MLIDELYINGHRVTWIDAKSYYGASDIAVRFCAL